MTRLSSCSVGLRRFCLTTNRRTPASSQALTMARPSCQRVAMGFSVITSMPALGHLDGLARDAGRWASSARRSRR